MNYKKGKVKNIHYGDIHTKFPPLLDCKNNMQIPFINPDIDLSKFDDENYLKNGDLIIADASEDYNDIGKAIEVQNIDDEKILAGLHTILARDEKDITVDGFKTFLFLSNTLKHEIKVIANGASVLGISKENLSKLTVKIPSIKEQQKIIDFLILIQEKLNLLEKKYEKTLEFKEYLMQNIFNENLVCCFNKNEHEKWKIFRIGELFKERSEKGFDNLELLSVTLNDGVVKRSDIESKDNSNDNKSNYKHVIPGDIVYNSMRMWQGASGVSKYEGIVSPAYTILKRNIKCDSEFFGYYFKTKQMINQFRRYSQGLTSDTWNLKYPLISKIKISIPSIKEQKRISEFLHKVDETLILLEKQLNKTKEFKKYLLQKMFV